MTAPVTIGLFEGYGGLTMAVEEVFGAELVAYSEFEPPSPKNPRPTQAAARLLAYRWPDVPNLGDVTTVDWGVVADELVGAARTRFVILAGGFPCQDLSLAGLRATPATRPRRTGRSGRLRRTPTAMAITR